MWWLIKASFLLLIVALIIAIIGAILDLIMKYWLCLLLMVIFSAVAYYLFKNKFRLPKIQMVKNSSAASSAAVNSIEITTREELAEFERSHILIRSFITKVVGVSYPNDDGSSRQEILSSCLRGEPVGFYWHTFNGEPACAVISDHGQIGYLRADLAADLDYEYSGDEYYFSGRISDITGGKDGLHYGCNILLSIYGPSG